MPISPIDRMPIFGLRAIVEEDAILSLGDMSKRGTSRFMERDWTLTKQCACSLDVGIKEAEHLPPHSSKE